ncbi:membrane protein insertion efficiency factor YidD [Candidatus Daviesbacteria bacterium]|nr:membrane protein insertion efficiency factor YidD [Candidatus Daviesbacteria bacterium]
MKKLLISLINFYQIYLSFDHGLMSIFTPGGACKYPISCSEYTKQSIIQYGVIHGGWMGLKRIWSCR